MSSCVRSFSLSEVFSSSEVFFFSCEKLLIVRGFFLFVLLVV